MTKLVHRFSRNKSEPDAETDLRGAGDDQPDKGALFHKLADITTYKGPYGS